MIKKKSFNAAFTLIELLVVITIIGILAGIALPVFNTVQLKGAQTKVLAQAKQVGLALKLYAGDNGGSYPVYTGTTTTTTTTAPTTGGSANATNSNQDFFLLFPTYTQSESIFANKYCYYNHVVPDNVIDPAGTTTWGTQTLKAGENSFNYMEGLNDSSNPGAPLVCDGSNASFQYVTTPNTAGYVWGNNKAVVVHLDNSASLDTLLPLAAGANPIYTDQQYDPNGTGGAKVNFLDPSKNTSCTGCTMCLPKY